MTTTKKILDATNIIRLIQNGESNKFISKNGLGTMRTIAKTKEEYEKGVYKEYISLADGCFYYSKELTLEKISANYLAKNWENELKENDKEFKVDFKTDVLRNILKISKQRIYSIYGKNSDNLYLFDYERDEEVEIFIKKELGMRFSDLMKTKSYIEIREKDESEIVKGYNFWCYDLRNTYDQMIISIASRVAESKSDDEEEDLDIKSLTKTQLRVVYADKFYKSIALALSNHFRILSKRTGTPFVKVKRYWVATSLAFDNESFEGEIYSDYRDVLDYFYENNLDEKLIYPRYVYYKTNGYKYLTKECLILLNLQLLSMEACINRNLFKEEI